VSLKKRCDTARTIYATHISEFARDHQPWKISIHASCEYLGYCRKNSRRKSARSRKREINIDVVLFSRLCFAVIPLADIGFEPFYHSPGPHFDTLTDIAHRGLYRLLVHLDRFSSVFDAIGAPWLSKVPGDSPEPGKRSLPHEARRLHRAIQAVRDVIMGQGLLAIVDRVFERLELSGELKAGPLSLDHGDDLVEVSVCSLRAPDNAGTRVRHDSASPPSPGARDILILQGG
jgi:hypothetical protein